MLCSVLFRYPHNPVNARVRSFGRTARNAPPAIADRCQGPLNTAIRLSSRDVTRGAPGAEATAETDSPLEGSGFEPSVPLVRPVPEWLEFEALGVTATRRAADPDRQPTIGFKAIMREAADTRSYAAALSVLVVAEWLYLDWASRAPQPE